MKKKKAIIINLIIIAFSLFVYMTATGGAFTPTKAHEKQERTIHYGPSKIVGVVEKGDSRFFLGQFNGYYSCSMVKRGFMGLWYGKKIGMWGMENDQNKPINYSQFYARDDDTIFDELYVYGVINDENIKRIEIEFYIEDEAGQTQTAGVEITGTDEIFEPMFFSVLKKEGMANVVLPKRVAAFNKDGELIYEEMDPNAEIIEERIGVGLTK